jgi:hypothetical protein
MLFHNVFTFIGGMVANSSGSLFAMTTKGLRIDPANYSRTFAVR